MTSEFILNIIYNPALAAGIAFVALAISLYVLYKQQVLIAEKINNRKLIQKSILTPETRVFIKDAATIALLVFILVNFFTLSARAEELKIQKYIHLGVRFLKYAAVDDAYSRTEAIVAESIDTKNTEDANVETLFEDKAKIDEDENKAVLLEEGEIKKTVATKTEIASVSSQILPLSEPFIPAIIVTSAISPTVQEAAQPRSLQEENVPEAEGPAPDIALSSFSYYGAPLFAGNIINFAVNVENDGEEDLKDRFNTQLFIDEGNDGKYNLFLSRIQTRPLEIGKKETKIWASAWIAKAGTHKAEVCADIDNVVLEMNEKNNCASVIFIVKSNDMSGDLVIEQLIMTPSLPKADENVSFSALVVNKAPSVAKGSYVYFIMDDKLLARSMRISSLSSGESEKIESKTIWKAAVGPHIYKICADGKKEVLETNEDNNCSVGTIFIADDTQ